jgi:hypothetical protein
MSYRYGEIRSPYIDFQEPLSAQDRHFVSCVATGTRPQTDGADGLAVVQVLEAADVALRESRRVSLTPAHAAMAAVHSNGNGNGNGHSVELDETQELRVLDLR